MKKNLLLIFLILSLLVSCATKSVATGDTGSAVEDIVAAPVVEPVDVVTEDPVAEVEVSEDIEVGDSDDFVLDESQEDYFETMEAVEVDTSEPMVQEEIAEPETDGSSVLSAVTEDLSMWETPFAEKPEEFISEIIQPSEDTETTVIELPVMDEVVETAPAVEEPEIAAEESIAPAETVSLPVVEDETASVSQNSFMGFVEKLGKFIVAEKLFSFGILTCIVGVIYLIVALIKTSEAHHEKDDYNKALRADREDDDDTASDPMPEDKNDTELSDEDDEFLRTLLGSDN